MTSNDRRFRFFCQVLPTKKLEFDAKKCVVGKSKNDFFMWFSYPIILQDGF